jgi:hypothetical protein
LFELTLSTSYSVTAFMSRLAFACEHHHDNISLACLGLSIQHPINQECILNSELERVRLLVLEPTLVFTRKGVNLLLRG